MGKRIILLLDGTWNDSEASDADTNIVRLRELILGSLDKPKNSDSVLAAKDQSTVIATERTYTFVEGGLKKNQITVLYYDRGVGTGGFFDKYLGGALGAGLERNVRRAYRFLAGSYRPGDEIFVMGFSRGAYTARSLAGFIAVSGLLRAEVFTPVNESRAWYYYRTSPKDRFGSIAAKMSGYVHRPPDALIECLAVFDTVGARGIPIRWFWRENRDLFEFHDVDLSIIAKKNLQALAIDEHRESFAAAIWRQPKMLNISSETEQVWFAGAHADVGGGYVSERSATTNDRLDDITLDWMVKRLKHHYKDFPIKSADLLGKKLDQRGAVESEQHEARRGVYRAFPFAWRAVGNASERFPKIARQVYVCQDRYTHPINESVHISVLERWGKRVKQGSFHRSYRPRNLGLAICRIGKTYRPVGEVPNDGLADPLLVVGWSGDVLSPSDKNDRETVRNLIDPFLFYPPSIRGDALTGEA